MSSRVERDLERARAAGVRRLQQTAAMAQRVRQTLADRAADEDAPSAAASFSAGVSPARQSAAAASSSVSASFASSSLQQAPPPFHAEPGEEHMDVARAIASRHQLRDGFPAEPRMLHRDMAPRAASASRVPSYARPHSARVQSSVAAAAASASPASPRARANGSFSGRSSYDLAGVLRARAAERDREIAQEFAQQEREEAAAHAASMAVAHAAMQPFAVTAEWRRRWAHTSHTKDCAICFDALRSGAMVLQLPCAHTYHESCLQPWLQRQSVCPTCRYDLKRRRPASEAEAGEGDEDA